LVDSRGEQRFHVEELRAHHRHQGALQYLVRWRGYPPDQDSWEPHEQLLDDVPDLVAAYRRAQGLESQ
jgi:chromobox protein 5